MMDDSGLTRLAIEIDLLQAMYPEQVGFDSKSLHFRFSSGVCQLQLRIPETYPDSGFPDVVSANDASKNDVRNKVKAAIEKLDLVEGDEALDAIVVAFQDIITETESASATNTHSDIRNDVRRSETEKTIVIWLHHLLALSKRKLALSPGSTAISGITKPGYPGIMVFTGQKSAVNDHVNALKAENWQAFQVRYEQEGELWRFAHGEGITEVETMAEVVKSLEVDGDDGSRRKEAFLKAAGIK